MATADKRSADRNLLGSGGLSPGTVIGLATQMIDRLESLSSCGIVHGDIQLGNFLMGKDGPHHRRTVHLIDFGLSSLSWSKRSKECPLASSSSSDRVDDSKVCSDPPASRTYPVPNTHLKPPPNIRGLT